MIRFVLVNNWTLKYRLFLARRIAISFCQNMDAHVPEKVQGAIFNQLLDKPENKVCADCPAKSPTWASIDLDVFIYAFDAQVRRNKQLLYSSIQFYCSYSLQRNNTYGNLFVRRTSTFVTSCDTS